MNAYSQSNASGNWNDFNDAEAQHGAFDLIAAQKKSALATRR